MQRYIKSEQNKIIPIFFVLFSICSTFASAKCNKNERYLLYWARNKG